MAAATTIWTASGSYARRVDVDQVVAIVHAETGSKFAEILARLDTLDDLAVSVKDLDRRMRETERELGIISSHIKDAC